MRQAEAPESVVAAVEERLDAAFKAVQAVEWKNTRRVLGAFQAARVGEEHFAGTTGYGHDDLGRECLESVVAGIFGAEAALVRGSIASGTHAIALALFGALAPGQELFSITGHPYDTLEEVIGLRGSGQGSLAEWGVRYREIDLLPTGEIDIEGCIAALSDHTSVIAIQRSRGYAWRPSQSMARIERAIAALRAVRPELVFFVDNCYGEFVEDREPTHVGADLVAGSLIKNPGAGIVPAGGYVAGRADLVHRAACRLTAPGIGAAGGATLDGLRLMFQGLFLAPHVVSEAVKGALLAAGVLQALGYDIDPLPTDTRTDIIQAIRLGDAKRLVTFCQTVQQTSPVHAHVVPEPAVVPGYEDDVVMAAGTFIEGSTIELSCDGPLREPFIAYWQGGLSYGHAREAIIRVVRALAGTP
ncbi:MAG: methionine gamma-lyase family protein [Candidatus Sericytochromatia bacterium]|nr:methionine gamma-lyase family protein [Candidatus Tanganyikabacteria bacterium]